MILAKRLKNVESGIIELLRVVRKKTLILRSELTKLVFNEMCTGQTLG